MHASERYDGVQPIMLMMMVVMVLFFNDQAMMSERTSPVCVDIYCQPDSLPQQHSLGFFITSTDADDDQDSGCCMEDGKHSPQDVSDGSCDTGTGSSCSDDERADAAECDGAASQREVACYTHVVSHVQHSSPLKNCLK